MELRLARVPEDPVDRCAFRTDLVDMARQRAGARIVLRRAGCDLCSIESDVVEHWVAYVSETEVAWHHNVREKVVSER